MLTSCWLLLNGGTRLVKAQTPAGSLAVSYKFAGSYFPLVQKDQAALMYTDTADYEVVQIASAALQNDLNLLSGTKPLLLHHTRVSTAYPVIIGTLGRSALIDDLAARKVIAATQVKGKWETFSISVVSDPLPGVKQALVIFGSDPRGTAFGVFELSRMIGISPLVWWADVKPAHHAQIYISPGRAIVGPPSVKYRGIFLNDEDWGLRPWAARMMDPDKKDIGPNTYARVFELLLRLKANYLWPAMHPGTKAFWYYKENPEMARRYDIILGSSHHEPMLRDTEFEWNENYKEEYGHEHGEWRYDTNRDEIYRFFDDRVKESVNNEAIYTVGMRATKDGGMQGPAGTEGKVKILEKVISDQRQILENRLHKPASEVPQVFCPYKEVLDLYRAGLKVPGDVTITWVDDNHGYIRQLPNPQEQRRPGGGGVYYHFSYWGTPQDYLWLCSTSPSLTAFEMNKAWHFNARRMWVFNVGDLKPAEMELQFAMDMAWKLSDWPAEKASGYARLWAAETFGPEYAGEIASIKGRYYQLAAAGKPEHIDRVGYTAEEIDERLKEYQELASKAEKLATRMPERLHDAFFELILYPVEGTRLMNEKIFYARKSFDTSLSAAETADYAHKAQEAYEQIGVLTKKYNETIAGGKWNGIMDAHPRNARIFEAPVTVLNKTAAAASPVPPVSGKNITVIPAAAFSSKHDLPGMSIRTIEGLGVSGRSLAVLPYPDSSFATGNIGRAPYAEYRIRLAKGESRVTVKCLPTFRVYDPLQMRYGIALADGMVQTVDLASQAETQPWEANVLRGYTRGETVFTSDRTKDTVLRIYFPDPGLVVSQLEISH